jgi:anti-anti-sigma regulatory factor
MIRITSNQQGCKTVVHLAGRLEEHHLAELQQHCTVSEDKLVIDLSEVRSADSESIRWMHAVAERGSVITGPSPYIALLLKRAEQL